MANEWDRVLAAHGNASVLERIPVETPEYFSRVEELLGMKSAPVKTVAETPREVVTEKQRTSFQAPPSREAVSLGKGQVSGTKVKLTAEERSMAASLGMTDVEYAKNKVAAIAEGAFESRH